MKDYRALINRKDVPSHIGIIMDGNGRWARKKSLPRSEGHRRGAEVIEPLMDAALDLGVRAVSLYAFSTENWIRPRSEVVSLWKLLDYFFGEKIDTLKKRGIRIMHSGLTERLPRSTLKTIADAVEETGGNRRLVLNFCINYGGRQEIIGAVNRWLDTPGRGKRITARELEKRLYTADLPPVDLMIRTGGEYRISNFLLWQIAYAELYFADVLWPDFRTGHLYKAIFEYQKRERRFGGL